MARVVVMSGISGSGKSHLIRAVQDGTPWQPMKADSVLEKSEDAYAVVSADHYFTDRNGNYSFDPSKLTQAHAACFRAFLKTLERLQSWDQYIYVDNTNITNEEISPYMLAAEAFDATAEIVTMECSILAAHSRNEHHVPARAVENQYAKLYRRVLPSRWKNTFVKSTFPAGSGLRPGGYR